MKKIFLVLSILHLTFSILPASQNPWLQKTSLPAQGRHGACTFSIGDRVYFGTGHNNGGNVDVLFDDWWEYDPGTDSWSQKANFGGGLRKWANAFSIGNKGYLGTGEDPSTAEDYDLWEYDPVQNTWTQKADLIGGAREGANSFTVANKAYMCAGSFWADVWEYDPANDTWTQMADFPDWGGRICSVSFSINGKGYMGLGCDGNNFQPNADWYEFDPSSNTWTQKANLPGPPRSGPAAFAVTGKGYIACGTSWPNVLDVFTDCYEYDPTNDTWKRIQDFPGQGRRFTVAASVNNRGYTCTGTNGINLNDLWEFNPSLVEGINTNEEKTSCSIFPNPMRDHATLQISSVKNDLRFILYDASGKKIREQKCHSSSLIIDRDELQAGIYFCSLSEGTKNLYSGKLIIE
ncbi:MAG TPA: T9SS type A sorting domain-containing protein [Bacteroidia bacterium]|jgi:N-acetylneuraminic acid mutarotase